MQGRTCSSKLIAFVLLAALPGCTGNLNRADGPLFSSTSQSLPDLEPRMPGALPTEGARGFAPVTDRATWEKTSIEVVQRQVEANPSYVTASLYNKTTARQRGEFPTTATVLDEDGNGGMMALEGVAAPFRAAWDLVASPIRMVIRPPNSVVLRPLAPARLETR